MWLLSSAIRTVMALVKLALASLVAAMSLQLHYHNEYRCTG